MEGVTMIDPSSTYIAANVTISRDVILYPDTWIEGKTIIGDNCLIGPGTFIADSEIGKGCVIRQSSVKNYSLPEKSVIGPFQVLGQ